MGAGYYGGFGNTNGSKYKLISAINKTNAILKAETLPKKLQKSYIKFVKDTTTNKYTDFRVSINKNGYVYQSTKPGNVPGSYAIYYKEVDKNGNTLKVYKDTYDNKGNFVHRKNK